MVVISPQQPLYYTDTYSTDTLVCPTEKETVVCHCYGVTESAIREAIDVLGASSVADVTATTRAGAGCNGCHCRIRRMLAGQPATCSLLEICNECGFSNMLCECRAA